jgi:hypothetical protein
MAKWIKASGEVVEVQPAAALKPNLKGKPKRPKFNLEELQKYVGGYIERVQIAPNTDMICNEEGKLKGLPVNHAATLLVHMTQIIVGDVLVVERGEW